MDTAPIKQANRRQIAMLVVGALVFFALTGGGVWALLNSVGKKPHKPPRITLLSPPPLPPPPKFERKLDQPKEEKEIKVEQPAPKQDATPPSPELKMEGPAGNGPSAFASGKITSEDVSKLGKLGTEGEKGGVGMFNPFNNYANLLKGELQHYLRKNKALHLRHYTVEVRLWVSSGGDLKRFDMSGSTGDSDTDDEIKQAMSSLSRFDQAPPAEMPQPIRLRIVTAG